VTGEDRRIAIDSGWSGHTCPSSPVERDQGTAVREVPPHDAA
jgi:hypothetical protein